MMRPGMGGGIMMPRHYGDGITPIHQRLFPTAPYRANQLAFINNAAMINRIRYLNTIELERNRYYWHEWGNSRYCHYYDQWGYHWYGFYVDDDYFWTRYWGDRYWWYDPYWHRWDYLRDGRWWWQDDDDVIFIYVPESNVYYRYDDAPGGVVMTPDPTPPIETPPVATPNVTKKVFYSADGSLSVTITADELRQAYLYDMVDTSKQPVLLGSGVTDVEFASPTAEEPWSVIITELDGSKLYFYADGSQYEPAVQPLPPPPDQSQGPVVTPPAPSTPPSDNPGNDDSNNRNSPKDPSDPFGSPFGSAMSQLRAGFFPQ
ncbi:MAG: hypothetical protein KGJ45_00960 [Elusimicrobia bacterium]|nr:hypothetical protein [Elusimicrobiota bacterium]